jgi:hypothetical protein
MPKLRRARAASQARDAELKSVTGPSAAWRAVQEPGLTKFERDRRAIPAMAGGYRTSFDFLETVGFTPGFTPSRAVSVVGHGVRLRRRRRRHAHPVGVDGGTHRATVAASRNGHA